jgi:hypothetical protein
MHVVLHAVPADDLIYTCICGLPNDCCKLHPAAQSTYLDIPDRLLDSHMHKLPCPPDGVGVTDISLYAIPYKHPGNAT